MKDGIIWRRINEPDHKPLRLVSHRCSNEDNGSNKMGRENMQAEQVELLKCPHCTKPMGILDGDRHQCWECGRRWKITEGGEMNNDAIDRGIAELGRILDRHKFNIDIVTMLSLMNDAFEAMKEKPEALNHFGEPLGEPEEKKEDLGNCYLCDEKIDYSNHWVYDGKLFCSRWCENKYGTILYSKKEWKVDPPIIICKPDPIRELYKEIKDNNFHYFSYFSFGKLVELLKHIRKTLKEYCDK